MIQEEVHIYTDGACIGNPGPGGWAALLRYADNEKAVSGAEKDSTNNRMELTAAIEGLKLLNRKCKVLIVTDSKYVMDGMTSWIHNWKKNNWLTSSKKPVSNADLWKKLSHETAKHDVRWEWVKGHSGHPENELVDKLAKDAITKL